jgi:hypothetical protein
MSYWRYYIIGMVTGILLISACNKRQQTVIISGNIQYMGTDTLEISHYFLHNPYHKPYSHKIILSDKHQFHLQIPLDTATVLWLRHKRFAYPVYAIPGQHIRIAFKESEFPGDVKVSSPESSLITEYNRAFQYYYKQNCILQNAINSARHSSTRTRENDILKLANLRILIAKEDLSGTPFNIYVYKIMNDYFTYDLSHLKNQYYLPDKVYRKKRDAILDNARSMGFFSLQSLLSQSQQLNNFIHIYFASWKRGSNIKHAVKINDLSHNKSQLKSCKTALNHLLKYVPDRKARNYIKVQLVVLRYCVNHQHLNWNLYNNFVLQNLHNSKDIQLFHADIAARGFSGK